METTIKNTDKTPEKRPSSRGAHLKPYQWKPGVSANPAGRPKGSRNKLAASFIDDVYEDWKVHGKDALIKVRKKKPDVYLRVVADLIPTNMKIEVTPLQKIAHQIIDVPVKESDQADEIEIRFTPADNQTPAPTHEIE